MGISVKNIKLDHFVENSDDNSLINEALDAKHQSMLIGYTPHRAAHELGNSHEGRYVTDKAK